MPKLWRSGHVVVAKALWGEHDVRAGGEVEISARDRRIVVNGASKTEIAPRSGL